MQTWFTADTHFSHRNIIKYCGRTVFMTEDDKKIYDDLAIDKADRFKLSDESLKNHDLGLIRRWNERVKKEDVVYHLGDLSFKSANDRGNGENVKPDYWLSQLNGNIILIQGNHDERNGVKTKIQNLVIKIGGKRINLVHSPTHADYNCEINLVGHVHNSWLCKRYRQDFKFTDCINVGVDVWNFKPVNWDEIMKKYRQYIRSNYE